MDSATAGSRDVRVGLIGFGFAGRVFHAPLIAGAPGFALAAICSSEPERVRAEWPDVPVEPTPAALLGRGDLDLVVVATPNDTHVALAQAALRADLHVVVDKPFTLTLAEAAELAALADERGKLLTVFHNRRWDGDFLTLQALLAEGRLGRITYMASHFDRFRPLVVDRWRERDAPGGGLWYDLGPHLLDQALVLFGWPTALSLDRAAARDGARADDWMHAVLRYGPTQAGLRVVLHASALAAEAGLRFMVHGTQGSYSKTGLDTQEAQLRAGARPKIALSDNSERTPSNVSPLEFGVDTVHGHLRLARAASPNGPTDEELVPTRCGHYLGFWSALRAAVAGTAANPVPPAAGMRVMALIEAGLVSADQRCEVECVDPCPNHDALRREPHRT